MKFYEPQIQLRFSFWASNLQMQQSIRNLLWDSPTGIWNKLPQDRSNFLVGFGFLTSMTARGRRFFFFFGRVMECPWISVHCISWEFRNLSLSFSSYFAVKALHGSGKQVAYTIFLAVKGHCALNSCSLGSPGRLACRWWLGSSLGINTCGRKRKEAGLGRGKIELWGNLNGSFSRSCREFWRWSNSQNCLN